jgi:hypothetical protein
LHLRSHSLHRSLLSIARSRQRLVSLITCGSSMRARLFPFWLNSRCSSAPLSPSFGKHFGRACESRNMVSLHGNSALCEQTHTFDGLLLGMVSVASRNCSLSASRLFVERTCLFCEARTIVSWDEPNANLRPLRHSLAVSVIEHAGDSRATLVRSSPTSGCFVRSLGTSYSDHLAAIVFSAFCASYLLFPQRQPGRFVGPNFGPISTKEQSNECK